MYCRIFRSKYILVFLIFISGIVEAQEKIDVSFESVDNKIYIYYTLDADPVNEYEIRVVLKRTSVPDFAYEPSDVAGDIGDGKYAGVKRTIIWNVSSSELEMFDGEDFYFKINAKKIEESGGLPWYAYVGGAVVGGVVAAVVLLTGSKESSNPPAASGLAQPPGRP